ncbi:MAG: hypothetical protein KME49_08470 [Brasilonema octagenarum HA4186-MV1]|jgi:hypothetical protein|nr:hypothetical protein [Brasilonema octagenarum HA4186-MV1]
MNQDTLIDTLNANRLMHSDDAVVAFEEALAELAKNPREEYLSQLHLVLDDQCEHEEVMYGLLHFLESFDMKQQLEALIDVVPQLIVRAPQWTQILHYRILNDNSARTLYKKLLRTANFRNRDLICQLLREIATNESPPLSAYAEFVLSGC